MSDRKDGGPAFPDVQGNARGFELKPGNVSVRDWFAGMALQGIIACPTAHTVKDTGASVDTPLQVSEIAYQYADAMIKERDKP